MLANKNKILSLIISYFLVLLFVIYLTFVSSSISLSQLGSYQIGQIAGSLTLTTLAIQLILSSRIKILEKGVGLDRLMYWHRNNAKIFLVFLILHPLLIFWQPIINGVSVLSILSSLNIYHRLGIASFLLSFLTLFVTVYSEKLKLTYEKWKTIHTVGYVIAVLGFVHSFAVGSGIFTESPLYYWWWMLALLSSFALFYKYLIRLWIIRNNWYKVVKITKETNNVISVHLMPLKSKKLAYSPGQFAFVSFKSDSVPYEEHHFTLSSAPSEKHISFTIKSLGDFTSKIKNLQKGDLAKIEGPYGVFSNLNHE